MRIALFGPGRIGAALFPLLERDGHAVTVLSRRDYGDFLSPDFAPEAAVCGLACDAALLLPGLFELNAAPERMLLANAEGTIRLAEALHAHQPNAHLVAFLDARIHWPEEALPPAIRAYMAAKRALADWVPRAAVDWGRATGARVNAIAPGPVLPPPHREHSEKAGECLTPRPSLDDLHAAVAFLLSAPSVTGQTLFVAAGQQMLGAAMPPQREVETWRGGDVGGTKCAPAISARAPAPRPPASPEAMPLSTPSSLRASAPRDGKTVASGAPVPLPSGETVAFGVVEVRGPDAPAKSAGQRPVPPRPPSTQAPKRLREGAAVALTVAGSDSGGGAGIQADLRAFRDFGVHGCSAITALTAQNPHGVSGVMPASPEILRGQLERIAEDFDVGAVKTGMLVDAPRIAVVADFLPRLRCPWVVDPVMVATSGARLLDAAAVSVLRERLLPHATLVTPNLPEAQALLGDDAPAETLNGQADVARRLHADLGVAVLVKGGHAKGRPSADILCSEAGTWLFEAPAIPHPLTTHGTGCALSSAIAARLALGDSLLEAIAHAKAYVLRLLSATQPAGRAAVYGSLAAHWETDHVTSTRL